MSRERAFSYLQQATYLLNFGVVVLVVAAVIVIICAEVAIRVTKSSGLPRNQDYTERKARFHK